jgi:1,4-alpha-glucan branching enzyme
VQPNGDVVYREWAPNALRAYLIGDFNGWNRDSHPMNKNEYGVFEITVPGNNGQTSIPHDSKIKVCLLHGLESSHKLTLHRSLL